MIHKVGLFWHPRAETSAFATLSGWFDKIYNHETLSHESLQSNHHPRLNITYGPTTSNNLDFKIHPLIYFHRYTSHQPPSMNHDETATCAQAKKIHFKQIRR